MTMKWCGQKSLGSSVRTASYRDLAPTGAKSLRDRKLQAIELRLNANPDAVSDGLRIENRELFNCYPAQPL